MTIDIISLSRVPIQLPRISSLAILIEYHKKRLLLIARFWLEFAYNLCDLLASKERIWWLVVLKYIFFKFFLSSEKM